MRITRGGLLKSSDAAGAYGANGISLTTYGLSDATTDIKTVLDAAVAAGARKVIVPYRAAAWPLLTKWTGSNLTIEFEPGARISANMATGYAMDLTAVTLKNASFTSPFVGPITTGNQTSYGDAGRALAIRSGCVIDTFYAEYASWAPLDIQDNATGVRIRNVTIQNCRHNLGWAAGIHADGPGVSDVNISNVRITNNDRAIEIESGASNINVDGFYLESIGPNGWTGQSGSYVNYTFCASVHSHVGEGACKNVHYRNGIIVNSAGGITCIRSNGTNASDLPDGCSFENITIDGYTNSASGNNAVNIQGVNIHVRNLKMSPGAGITNLFNVLVGDSSVNCTVEVTEATAMALPLLKTTSTAQGTRFNLNAAGVTPNNTGDWLIDVLGPNTKVDLNVDSVTGTVGYARLNATAHYSTIDGYWKTAVGETFLQAIRIAGPKNAKVSGLSVASATGSLDVYVTTSATGLIINDFAVDRVSGSSVTFDNTTSNCTFGASVYLGGGTVSDSGTNNRGVTSNYAGTAIIDIFTASGTWTKRTGLTAAAVYLVPGGSGGGSGRRGAAGTARVGGGGGGAASLTQMTIPAALLPNTAAVTVGAAGAGGAAVTTDDTNGNAGGAGGNTQFANIYGRAGGPGAGGGNGAGGAGGAGGVGGTIASGGAGGSAAATGTAGVANGSFAGGAGGGITTANAASAGGPGGGSQASGFGGLTAATAGTVGTGTGGGNGANGVAPGYPNNYELGLGGAGGGSDPTGAGGAGGNGGGFGGPGGGGAASTNGANSGKGGDGTPGVARVVNWF